MRLNLYVRRRYTITQTKTKHMPQNNLIPPSINNKLPAMVRHEVANLTPQSQEAFIEEYRRKAKSSGVAYLLWFFLGFHYAYVGKWGMLVLFWVTFGGFFIWWLVDAFRIPGVINDYNKDVAVDTLRNLKALQQ